MAAYKPVVTGLDEPPEPGWPRDHELLAAAAGVRGRGVAPHTFGPPVSPHLAAELAGDVLELDAMVAAARRGREAPTCSWPRASAACSCR